MDIFVSFKYLYNVHIDGLHSYRFFAITLHGRTIMFAMAKYTVTEQYVCFASPAWVKYLNMLGINVPDAKLFQHYQDAERYSVEILNSLQAINYHSPCSDQKHLPDITTCTIAWFSITITSSITMKIPNCMHRHVMQHLTTTAILLHGRSVGIEVSVENMHFTTGTSDFMIENNLSLGDIVLFRHIGFFTFETFFFYGSNGEKKMEQRRYGEYITTRHFESDQLSINARSALPPSFSFKLLNKCYALYSKFCTPSVALPRLSLFLSRSDVFDETLTIIVGNKQIEINFQQHWFTEQWEEIKSHFQITPTDDVVLFNVEDNVIQLLIIGNCHVENIYPWSAKYWMRDNLYGELNQLNNIE